MPSHPSATKPLLEVRGLSKAHTQGRWWQRQFQALALDNIDLTLNLGSTLALVGESGAGKSTLAMCLVGLLEPDAGEIVFDGKRLNELRGKERESNFRKIQLIFQDSEGSLNPRMPAVEIIEEPLVIAGEERILRCQRALRAMEQVGLPSTWSNRRPRELSGGQRQRLAIARALLLEPKLLILDEVLAGLDPSIQGQISNLLLDLQSERNLSYLCISHDLAHVGQFSDEVALIHRGKITGSNCASQTIDKPPEHSFGASAGG